MSLKQIPNLLTLVRIFSAPVMILLLTFTTTSGTYMDKLLSFIAAIFFTATSITDMLDGYLARKFNWDSNFGKMIDPLADKVLLISTLIMLIPLGYIPAWLVTLILLREVMMTSLRSLAIERGIIIPASQWGKYKTAFLSSATVGLLLHYPFLGVNWNLIGWALLIPGVFFSFGSALRYGLAYFKQH